MLLQNKTVIVTGAASGIGREIAQRFPAEGANVVVADIHAEAARATAAELDRSGRAALGIGMDVTDEAQVGLGVDVAVRRFGGIDVLVSNAGIRRAPTASSPSTSPCMAASSASRL